MTTLARFLAVARDGGAELREYPLPIAQAVAETLRQAGFRIVWYPVVPEPVAAPAGPTKRERRRSAREQRQQLAELGVPT